MMECFPTVVFALLNYTQPPSTDKSLMYMPVSSDLLQSNLDRTITSLQSGHVSSFPTSWRDIKKLQKYFRDDCIVADKLKRDIIMTLAIIIIIKAKLKVYNDV